MARDYAREVERRKLIQEKGEAIACLSFKFAEDHFTRRFKTRWNIKDCEVRWSFYTFSVCACEGTEVVA